MNNKPAQSLADGAVRNTSSPPRPVVLCILDGWGQRADRADNAIAQAQTPNWDRFVESYPHTQLQASGARVGLPDGQMGNSEVGHMTLGSGRIVMQDLPRIDDALASGALAKNPVLQRHIDALLKSGGACHLMGLFSPGGVHAHTSHMMALAETIGAAGVPVCFHAFLDGRDTPPKAAAEYVRDLVDNMPSGTRLATITGRYYAMDRDRRWERVARAYATLVMGEGARIDNALKAIEDSYGRGIDDEFFEPHVMNDYAGMRDGDGILIANFRSDRAREILTALIDPQFNEFPRAKTIQFAAKTGMVEYSDDLAPQMDALFPPTVLNGILAEQVAGAGRKQLHIAETEKYAHVTFFFNGGRETPYPGEERILVPSPRVATYDMQPEMSAQEVTDKLVEAIGSAQFDLIVVNYANGDMVGHTGVLAAAIKAAETIDGALGRLEKAVTDAGGTLLVTADHGNCELMKENGQPHTAHTLNLVPLVLINGPAGDLSLKPGGLADIAPTVLTLMQLPIPTEMTGQSLLVPDSGTTASV